MRRQKRCSNPPPVPATWTRGVLEGTGPLRRRRRTSVERISPPTPLLLTRLVKNSLLLLSKLPPTQRRTKTTNEVPGTTENERDKVVIPTPLPRVLISFPRRMEKTGICPRLNALTIIGKDITPRSIIRIRKRGQKTRDGLGNLHAGDCS